MVKVKYVICALLGISIHVGIQECLDFVESKRYLTCTLKTHDYKKCGFESSWLYQNYPGRPALYDCVWPDGRERWICKALKIERSK